MMKAKSYLLLVIPPLVTGLVFMMTRSFDYVWDDLLYLGQSSPYLDASITECFSSHFVLSTNYFRPLAVATLVLDLGRGGGIPASLHLTSVLVHAINTALLSLLAFHVAGRRTVPAILAGLAFGLHPVMIEGVAFISSRFDLLVTTFLLAALLADTLLTGRQGTRAAAVGIAFLLATLCKESAVCLLLVLPAWHAFRSGSVRSIREGSNLLTYGALLVAGVLYLLLRGHALGHVLDLDVEGTVATGGFLTHALLVLRSTITAIAVAVWPFTTLSPVHHTILPVPANDPVAWVGLIMLMLAVAGLVHGVEKTPRWSWLAVAFLLSLAPSVNILPLQLQGGAYFAERYLVFPVAVLVLSLLVGYTELERSSPLILRKLGLSFAVLWIGASLITVLLTTGHWKDEKSLWTWGVEAAPESALPHTNLAGEHLNLGEYDACVHHGRLALQLDPTSADAASNLGSCLMGLGRMEAAGNAFELATVLDSRDPVLWTNLGVYHRAAGRLDLAIDVLREYAVRLDPENPTANLMLGMCYMDKGVPEQAIPHLERAIKGLHPDHQSTARSLLRRARQQVGLPP